jgi:imidazolonepropionase-like amidohydrolase
VLELIPNRPLRLEHLSVYDGLNNPVVRDATLIIDGDRITWAATNAPAAAEHDQVINATGYSALPGLMNCHVHMFSADPQPLVLNSIKATRIAERMLMCGITTIRSLGGEKTQLGEITLRDAIRKGVTPGPRMFAAGSRITMTGGFGARNARVADGPDELRKAAREQLEAGADLIKLVATKNTPSPGREMAAPELSVDEMAAAVEEAAKWGKYTAAHAMGTTGIKNALRAGVECIEHGNLLDDEAIELLLSANAWLDPTFSVHERQIANAGDL